MGRSLPSACSAPLRRRSRYTLKADPVRSFQAQAADGTLIDIVPLLQEQGISLPELRAGMRAGTGSQPMTVPAAKARAIAEMLKRAPVGLARPELRKLRRENPDLASAEAAGNMSANQPTQQGQYGAHCGC